MPATADRPAQSSPAAPHRQAPEANVVKEQMLKFQATRRSEIVVGPRHRKIDMLVLHDLPVRDDNHAASEP